MKRDMGFRGFVQSDWYATTKLSVAEGLDQEMPGNNLPPYPRGGWFGPEALEKVDSKMIDDSALRILAAMYRTGLFDREDGCSPPSCGEFQRANVTSDDHAALARRIATESVVLLKNERDLLPVPAGTQKIAVVGAAAAAPPNNHAEITDSAGDYYSAGGSGHVVGPYVITPLDGISQRAEAAGVEVIQSPSNDISAAVAAAKAADITVVVAATTCSEGADRTNLTLDGDADAFIEAVAAASSQVVVLAQAPGVFLTPWRDSVSAVLAMFLGGQETGAAWGAVLFGDHAPTGRLPVMLPASEASVIPTSDEDTVVYSEGLATSYRNPEFEAAFPFGHGLTYTSFRYGRLRSRDCDGEVCISMKLSNSGKKKGRAVPQLYLEFPTEASQPAKVLKGFEKTALIEPGASTHVTFRLSARDRSYWLDGAWVPVTRFQVHVGESSTDIRRSKWVHADEFESPLVVV